MTAVKSRKSIVAFILVMAMAFSLLPAQASAASKIKMSKCKITIAYTSDVYTGNQKKPKPTVKYNNKTLKKGTDYTVSYSNNVNPGTAKVKIKGKGKYTGTVTKSCRIYVKPVQSMTAKAVSGDSIQLTWGKATGSSKYQITVTSNGAKYGSGTYSTSGTSYKFTKLPAGKTYNFSIVSIAGPKSTKSTAKAVSLTLQGVDTLATPTISGNSPGYRRCDVSWSAVPKATGYYVNEYNVSTKKSATSTISSPTQTWLSFYGRTTGAQYQYKVQAFTICNGKTVTGPWSKTITIAANRTYIGQACGNYDGKAGDGSGKEVTKSNWTYSSSSSSPYNWTYVFRFKDPNKAAAAAMMMEKGIANNNIGYCSNGTSTYGSNALQYQAQKVGYDLSRVANKTGCSCGDIVTLCVKYSGINCAYTGAGLSVAKELKKFSGDFTCYTDSKYVASDAYLQRGDILVTAHSNGKNNHVCMVL